MENEGVIILLEAIYWVLVTHGYTRFLQVQVLIRYFYRVTISLTKSLGTRLPVVVVLGLGLVGPRVYG